MIIGHGKQLKFLERLKNSGKIPHALLFSGQEKLGKKTIALEFVRQILGENQLNHPDFTLLGPLEKQIQIDQIRELSWRLSLKAVKSSIKEAVIDRTHLMTLEAQNSFLKTLEEPRGDTVLILITEYPNFLLPTINSRCQNIKFYPVEKKEIENYLREKKVERERAEKILEVAQGRPGLVLEFLENPEKLAEREKRLKELLKLSNSSLSLRFRYAKDLAESQDLMEVLNIWLYYFRNILISKKEGKTLLKIKKALENIQKTIFLILTTNVNQRLALEILLMEF